MTELKQAMNALLEARPDPAKVEALTAETLARRDKPYTPKDAWATTMLDQKTTVVTCLICRLPVQIVPYGHYSRPFPFPEQHPDLNTHLEWHNSSESRLRKLEEG